VVYLGFVLWAWPGVNKIAAKKTKKGLKESMNLAKKVCFFVKIYIKRTQMAPFLDSLLCSKPIFGPKTKMGLGLFGSDWV